MNEDKVIALKNPGTPSAVTDALTELLREGAQRMLASAIEAEVNSFLERFADHKTVDGHQRVVRNGRLPGRCIQTGVGAVEVSVPRIRDRDKTVRFTSSILPPYLRRTKTLEELLPWLYLKGISTGDFQEALTALLGLVGQHDQSPQGSMARRARALVTARSIEPTLRVSMGGRYSFRGTARRCGPMYSGGDRCDGGWE